MRRILNWIRWPNLLIVFITLAFIRYGLLGPALLKEGLGFDLDTFSFLLLSLTTMMITFGGYVINDIYDQHTDAQNKPDRLAVGQWISIGRAKAIYIWLGIFGLLISCYLAETHQKWQWIWIYPLAVALLWLYSARLKGSVLWGNILVSVFCSAVALLIPFAEKENILQLQEGEPILRLLFFYAGFAGLSNLLREIIKDAEDVEGDRAAQLNTLAVRKGLQHSKVWAQIIAFTLLGLLLLFTTELNLKLGIWLGFYLFTLPFLLRVIVILNKKANDINWKAASLLVKYLMLGGLIGMLFLI